MFDFCSRKKVKALKNKISELEEKLDNQMGFYDVLKTRFTEISDKYAKLNEMVNGKHSCNAYCTNCTHRIVSIGDIPRYQTKTGWVYGSSTTEFICDLDCPCKDFQQRDVES